MHLPPRFIVQAAVGNINPAAISSGKSSAAIPVLHASDSQTVFRRACTMREVKPAGNAHRLTGGSSSPSDVSDKEAALIGPDNKQLPTKAPIP